MVLLGLIFLVILLIVFGIVAFMMRPTPEQNAVQRRIETFIASQAGSDSSIGKTNNALIIAEPKSFESLDVLVANSNAGRKLKTLIVQSQKNISVGTILIFMVILAVGTFLVTYVLSSIFLVALAVAVIASYAPIAVLRMQSYRRITAFNTVLPDCIETCARSLRAGHSIVAAIDIVAELSIEPAKTEFREVFKKQNYGLPLRDALMQMLDRVPSSDLQVLITGILVQKDTGGNLAEILDRIASVIRDRLRIQGEIRTHTAQGRLTGWILFLLPLVMMFSINIVNPGYSSVLFEDPMGKKMLYVGLVLLVIGGLLIRQIIKGIEV